MAVEGDMDELTSRWAKFELVPPAWPHALGDPPWLTWALRQIGVKEVAGLGDNPDIRAYHSYTWAGEAPDSVPWCSSFANAALELGAGIHGTRSKAARSWLSWSERKSSSHRTAGGRALDAPRRGCLAVFSRGPAPSGHVAFWLGEQGGLVTVVGGNQSNAVSIASYPLHSVIGYVWPKDYVEGAE